MAQLVAHPLDVREVTSSSLVSSTNFLEQKSVENVSFRRFFVFFEQVGAVRKSVVFVWVNKKVNKLADFALKNHAEKH